MRRLVYLVILLSVGIASAQTTTVTGTVSDSDSIAWQNGTITFTLTSNNPNIPPSVGGVPLTSSQINFTIPLDGTGSFSTSVADTNFVQPISLWSIKICSNTSAPCASLVNMQIKGGSQNLTPTIASQITAIRLAAGYSTRAYADVEISPPPIAGSTYYNTISNLTRQWNGSAWVNSGSGGAGLNPVAPSGDTTGATDLASINAACTNYGGAQLSTGAYYINGTVNVTANCRILGAGAGTVIHNKGTTNDWFRISYYTQWAESPWVYPPSTNQSEIGYMQFAQDNTPTSGCIFNIGSGIPPSGGTYYYTMNVSIHDTVANNAYDGACFQDSQLYAFVYNNVWRQFVGRAAIYYNAQIGSGDNHINDNEFSGLLHSGIIIAQSDTQMFSHDKLNGSGVQFTGVGLTKTVQFNDLSVETGISEPCAWDFGTGQAPVNTQINGGESYGFSTLICHPANVNGLAYSIANSSATSDFAAGMVTNNGWFPLPNTSNGLANASLPTFSPIPATYGGTTNVTITCATGTPYYTLGAGAVTQYSAPVAIASTSTLKAGCYGNGINNFVGGITGTYTIATFQDSATFSGTSGTLVSAYTTTAGKTFALYSGNGTATTIPQLSGSTSTVLPSGTDSTYGDSLDTLTPSSANYTVGITCTRTGGSPTVGVFARAASASNTNYILQYNSSVAAFQIFAQYSGTYTQLNNLGFTWATGVAHAFALSVSGTSISMYLDGNLYAGPYTDSHVAAAGQAGFRITGGSNVNCTNFYVQ